MKTAIAFALVASLLVVAVVADDDTAKTYVSNWSKHLMTADTIFSLNLMLQGPTIQANITAATAGVGRLA
jgi:hypothetical protein